VESTILIFETHATSLDNEAGLASGWFDVDLSPLGEQQARELGERRREDPPAAVYCSDLLRAHRTARIAFDGSGVAIVSDPRLRECDYGALTRHPVAEVEALRATHIRTPFPDGESYEGVTRRVEAWLRRAARAHHGATLLVVGHRATFYALEHLLNGRPLEEVMAAPWVWQPGWLYSL
jgi:broad specificity phosphatase PhoE